MKKFGVIFSLIIIFGIGCDNIKSLQNFAGKKNVVAKINDLEITSSELDSAAASQLKKLEMQTFQIKRRTLDSLIQSKLIEAAAKNADLSIADYLKREVKDKITPPSESELKALFESGKGKTKKSFEEMKPEIANYLIRNQAASKEQELITSLKRAAEVKVFLEPPRIKIDTNGAPSLGDKNAPVTIVEFSDYQCPFCKRVQPTFARISNEYKDKVRRVFLDFPLSFHAEAQKAHEAALCAGDQDKYFEYNQKLWDNQRALEVKKLKKYAKQTQLDTKKFNDCLDSGANASKVLANVQKGVTAGVSGTPAFFINGIMLSGAQPFSAFKELIDNELNN